MRSGDKSEAKQQVIGALRSFAIDPAVLRSAQRRSLARMLAAYDASPAASDVPSLPEPDADSPRDIAEMFGKLAVDVPVEAERRSLDRMLAAIGDESDALVARRADEGSERQFRVWPKRLARSAGAAALAASLLVVFVHLWGQPVSAAFGEMIKNVQSASSVAFRLIVQSPGEGTAEVSEVLMDSEGNARVVCQESDSERIDILNRDEPVRLVLRPHKKLARLMPRGEDFAHASPLEDLRTLRDEDASFLREETIDSVKTRVYEVRRPEATLRVWIDEDRLLPVRLEVQPTDASAASPSLTLESFQWNPPIPENAFAIKAPQDYVLEQPSREGTEQDLLFLLRFCANPETGVLPDVLDRTTAVSLLYQRGYIATEAVPGTSQIRGAQGGSEEPKALWRQCLRGLAFIDSVSGRGWCYQGAGTRLGDPNTVVCSWNSANPGRLRVVYADLRIKDLGENGLSVPHDDAQ